MHFTRMAAALALAILPLGCGSGLEGTYRGDARLMAGRQESTEPGYSLSEVRERIASEGRSLTLHDNGRFSHDTGTGLNEGTWRVEGDKLILRSDITNGNRVLPALQDDDEWQIGPEGELIRTGTYSHYGLEEFYTKAP
jgi:hypothetical protein